MKVIAALALALLLAACHPTLIVCDAHDACDGVTIVIESNTGEEALD